MTEERKSWLMEQLRLLQKATWRWKDISTYYGCASAKANEIRKAALAKGGKIDYDPHAVQSRTVLMLEGTSPEEQIRLRTIELMGASDQTPKAND